MAVNCGKGFLYFYNLIFLGIAGGLMYLSVLFVMKWGDYTSLSANTYTIVPVGIIFGFGIIVFITGVVGCCGTCNESRCTLGVFFSLLLVILSVEIVTGSLVYVKKNEIESELQGNLWQAFHKYYDEHSSTRTSFDKMQRQLQCCGVMNSTDWSNVTSSIPESCCIHPGVKCDQLPNNIYTKGCYDELLSAFNTNLKYIMGVMISFAILQEKDPSQDVDVKNQLIGMILCVYLIIVLRRAGYFRIFDSPAKS